jgi:hypothetical protein
VYRFSCDDVASAKNSGAPVTESPFQKQHSQPVDEIPLPQREIRRRSPLRTCGCLVALLVWLVILVIFPCGFVTLLVEKEIRFSLSDLPDNELRLFLLNSEEVRALGLQRPDIYSGGEDEGEYCILITTSYLAW